MISDETDEVMEKRVDSLKNRSQNIYSRWEVVNLPLVMFS